MRLVTSSSDPSLSDEITNLGLCFLDGVTTFCFANLESAFQSFGSKYRRLKAAAINVEPVRILQEEDHIPLLFGGSTGVSLFLGIDLIGGETLLAATTGGVDLFSGGTTLDCVVGVALRSTLGRFAVCGGGIGVVDILPDGKTITTVSKKPWRLVPRSLLPGPPGAGFDAEVLEIAAFISGVFGVIVRDNPAFGGKILLVGGLIGVS